MKALSKNAKIGILLLLSAVAGVLYIQHREEVFPLSPRQYWLDHRFTSEEVKSFLHPLIDLSGQTIEFDTDTFVDRNSVKFLIKNAGKREFEDIVITENLPLWGWDIHIYKPHRIELKISQKKQLIGLILPAGIYPTKSANEVFKTLNTKIDKNLVLDQVTIPYQEHQEIKFENRVKNTNLLEKITLTWIKGRFQKMESALLLPTAYAQDVNQTIEKQRTLHQVFNSLHYILIGIVFLFLFRIHETQNLSWKKSFPIFSVYFLSEFFTIYYQDSSYIGILSTLFHTFLKTIGSSLWIYLLIVVADFIARTHRSSKYSLTDLHSKSFFQSSLFRRSILAGWTLAVWQIIFVFCFYKVFSSLSMYIPLKIPGEHTSGQHFEFLRYFFESLSTAFYEEVLYRLFFIYFFITIFKRIWPAVLLSSVIWGFLHISYQFEPYYVRGLELTLVGLLYGFFLVRYGILAVMTAHFFYNGFIMSEYEQQSLPYLICIHALFAGLYFGSLWLGKKKQKFEFKWIDLKSINSKTSIHIERRSKDIKIYPLNWKYASFLIIVLMLFLIWYPIKNFSLQPTVNHEKLRQISYQIIAPYAPMDQLWSVVFQREHPDIRELRTTVQNLDKAKRSKILSDLESYTHIWSVRYFLKPDYVIFCDLDFSYNYELLRMNCPDLSSRNLRTTLNFFDWVHMVKSTDETWTLSSMTPQSEKLLFYQYRVVAENKSPVQKTVSMTFYNQQLTYFKKSFAIPSVQSEPQRAKKPYDWIAIGISLVIVFFVVYFVRMLMDTIRRHRFYEKKALYGAIATFFIYFFWNLNAYKSFLSAVGAQRPLASFLTLQAMYFGRDILLFTFASYVFFYSFFYFPKHVFDQAPTIHQWDSIISRPIWKWRNARASLFYAALLLCIQMFLRFLIQIDNNFTNFDLFHFDVAYLNHRYLFITFLGVIWRNLLFWVGIIVLASALEKYVSRWIYLPVVCGIIFVNELFSAGNIDSKLIELCSIYIVFYFVFNIAKFDFAFYFWFILLNSTLPLLPILIYPEYKSYSYQVYFIYIFVVSMMLYTLLRNNVRFSLQSKNETK